MAKKSRKPNLSEEVLARARRELYGKEAVQPHVEKPVEKAAPVVVRHAHTPVKTVHVADLRREYAYVITDLRNMGILAAALMALLVVLSLFI